MRLTRAEALREQDEVDEAAVLAVMGNRHPSFLASPYASFQIGQTAWPGYPHPTARAARVLKALRRQGLAECVSHNGLWRLTNAGVERVRPTP
jgi:hypothetical protein